MSHESQNREDNKSGDETGATVEQTDPETVPGAHRNPLFYKRETQHQCASFHFSLVTVVVVFAVAAQDRHSPLGQAVREEDLRSCFNPDL